MIEIDKIGKNSTIALGGSTFFYQKRKLDQSIGFIIFKPEF